MGLFAKLIPARLKRHLLASLGDSEEKFARVFHTSPDWIVITRLSDSKIIDANLGFQTLSGFARDEVVGRFMKDLNIWAVPQERAEIVAELQRDGLVRHRTATLRRRDGNIRHCMLSCTLIALDGDLHNHAVWVVRDITDQSAAQDLFGAAFRLTPDFMSISRMQDGTYIDVNEAFERITGIQRTDAIGKTSTELNIWHRPEEREALVRLLFAHGHVQDFPARMNTRHGGVLETLVNAVIFESRGEKLLIALSRDVTENRRAQQALQDSEARFSRLFELSPLPMCYTSDRDGFQTTQWNQSWFEAFGFDPAQAQGKSGLELGIWVDPQLRKTILSQSMQGDTCSDIEVQMRRKSGELRWISLSTRIFVEHQRTMVLFAYVDITERKRIAQAIQDLNAQLEARVAQRTAELLATNQNLTEALNTLQLAQKQLVQSEKLAALGALVAGVAHELNTPIGNGLTVASSMEHRVQEFSALLDQGIKRSDLLAFVEDTKLAADILARNLGRAGALVSSFKQVAVDQTSSQRRKFTLVSVVSEIVVTLNPTIRKTNCTVQVSVDDALVLDSYPGPLGQVLTNLINNAILHGYGPAGSGTIYITATQAAPDSVTLEVRDDGQGISSDDLRRVFEPFFTTRLGKGGSGLGLHIVHNMVTSVLGGTIQVRSVMGAGTVFTLQLPLHAPTPSESPESGH